MLETPVEIVIVDDDRDLLEALRDQVGAMGYDAVAFDTPDAALSHLAKGNKTTCMILDLYMPGMSGLELQGQLDAMDRPLSIVFLSGQASIPDTVKAIRGGAVDFLEKPVEHEVLARALTQATEWLAKANAQFSRQAAARTRIEQLTDREADVFRELITGASTKMIARNLGISDHTVTAHRAAVMRKLDAVAVPDLIALAEDLKAYEPHGAPEPSR